MDMEKDVLILLDLTRDILSQKSKDEMIEFLLLMRRTLLSCKDKICGPREAAKMFDRKKSWIYDAINRPRTDLQREVAKVAKRDKSGLIVFSFIDLVVIRNRLLSVGGVSNA